MSNFLAQVQLVLAALGAFLPLIPDKSRAAAANILNGLADALTLATHASADFDDLAAKLKALRGEVEAMAASGAEASEDEIEAAFARVSAASAAFRAALG
jgi:hypothetical protein